MPDFQPTRTHRTRLMQIWRSAGWPCKDALEIDLLAARLVAQHTTREGHEVLRLTDAGITLLAEARQRGLRALSAHDRLAERFAGHLLAAGRIVWRELPLRAALEAPAAPADAVPRPTPAGAPRLWADDDADGAPAPPRAAQVWRMARPDLFSVRNTSVPAYLQPMVHEVKASRADLLSDLRHADKRQAYQWLCEECYYVFPAGIATPEEIPEQFGVWVLHGKVQDLGQPGDSSRFELLRPARHARCTLPFAVWMTLCKATPVRGQGEPAQAQLGEGLPAPEAAGDADAGEDLVALADAATPCGPPPAAEAEPAPAPPPESAV
ncbi:hypothetical protein [Acidovorax sp. FG27]|uniref:hypothetical protein n=1 Tax=Acidovorax sp. FG27 TaxID=3133652 RepID=UPI0030E9E8A4